VDDAHTPQSVETPASKGASVGLLRDMDAPSRYVATAGGVSLKKARSARSGLTVRKGRRALDFFERPSVFSARNPRAATRPLSFFIIFFNELGDIL
jgi:hypothetical protein